MVQISVEYQRDSFLISTAPGKLDVDFIHTWLSTVSYWGQGRSREVVETSIANSICFGVYDGAQQIGLARLVSDQATFAWIADVFIAESHRGRGLGKWLMECVVAYCDTHLPTIKRLLLATRDAHGLYRQSGFVPLENPENWMTRRR